MGFGFERIFFLSFGVRFWVFCYGNPGFCFEHKNLFCSCSNEIIVFLAKSLFFLQNHSFLISFAGVQLVLTGHFKPFRAIGSIRNEFAASISSSASPPRPPLGFPRAIFGKSDLQVDQQIAHKSTFEPITGLRHYSS